MKLATIETTLGQRVVGVTNEASPRFVDLMAGDASLPRTMIGVLAAEDGLRRAALAFQAGLSRGFFVEGQLLAQIPKPEKVICIGLNYRDHAEKSGVPVPTEPVVELLERLDSARFVTLQILPECMA